VDKVGSRAGETHAPSRALGYGVLCGWLALLVFVEWQPFNFNLSPSAALGRLRAVSLVPFSDYQGSDYLQAFDQICSKTALYLPVGAILAWLWRGTKWGSSSIAAVSAGLALTTLLEAGQLFLPTRFASVTDVLIETFGVWLGFITARRGLIRK
jgi:glycopeptide antibiotics resistance protein